MAGSVNKVILVGQLGKDPEVRTTQSGSKVVSFSVATSESWKDKSTGEKREKTEWHRIQIWNEGIGGVAERFLKKGSKVYIEGQLQTREWTDNAGVKKYTTEVVLQQFRGELTLLGDPKGGGRAEDDSEHHDQRPTNSTGRNQPASKPADFDDDLPF